MLLHYQVSARHLPRILKTNPAGVPSLTNCHVEKKLLEAQSELSRTGTSETKVRGPWKGWKQSWNSQKADHLTLNLTQKRGWSCMNLELPS